MYVIRRSGPHAGSFVRQLPREVGGQQQLLVPCCSSGSLLPLWMLLLLLLRAEAITTILPTSTGASALPELPCAKADLAAPPRLLPRGVVSIVDEFGADPTGNMDSTVALQRAFVAARTDNVTLFVPLGCFRLTDTVTATQPRNGRWQPTVVVGERPETGGRAPTFFLPPGTPAFSDPEVSKPVLFFITNWCLEPGAALGVAALGCNTSAQPLHDWHSSAYQFNMALQGVDIILGENNPSAVGVDMNAAQGSTIENVNVFAGPDAQAGVAGGNGGGGSFKGKCATSSSCPQK